MNILVIAPHHDDEVLGCGGTIVKHNRKGDKIWVVYITAGWLGIPEINSKQEAIKIREEEARKACNILGVKKLIFMRQKDRNISIDDNLIKELIKIMRKLEPNIIYAPHPEENDREHKIVYEITKEASWLSCSPYLLNLGKPIKSIATIYLYEVWTPMKNFYLKENITEEIDIKLKALSEYKSQLKHLNLIDAIYGLNMYRGSMTNDAKRFAEVFQIEKP